MLSKIKNLKLKKSQLAIFIILLILAITAIDLIRIRNYKTINSLPVKKTDSNVDRVYYNIVNDSNEINWQLLDSDLEYINRQYDVSDFHVATLIRILFDYPEKIPALVKSNIQKTLFSFRYWMDEPGSNAMCYWSENHQILFASSEYLCGQQFPNEVFVNDGLCGRQHMQKAKKRIFDWLEMRWKFGFSEFYSNVYYNEDIAGLINLIDYSNDTVLVKKAEIILDLLLYDIAAQKTGNMFVSVSGRLYERHRKGGRGLSSRRITDYVWNNIRTTDPHISYALLTSKKYHVPRALLEIGNDTSSVVIKQCNGLNISQLEEEGYSGSDERSIMMQWSMEAFSNPLIVRNSLAYIRRNNMFTNEFLTLFKYADFSLIRWFHLEPIISRIINPQSNGTAIEQANTYTYRTKDYSLYSVQNYFPGNYANQVHVAGMNIDSSFSIFHLHPALARDQGKQSPNYWVGYGRLPHVVQDSSISLAIYDLPEKNNLMEMSMLGFTHAYFPKEKFDSVMILDNYAFGKKGNTYCAMIGSNYFYYDNNSNNDLIQQGRKTFWIIEAGNRTKDGSFERFRNRILRNKITFDSVELKLVYKSSNKELKLKFAGEFEINGKKVNTCYERFDSPYVRAKYKPDSVSISKNSYFLQLNFEKCLRRFN